MDDQAALPVPRFDRPDHVAIVWQRDPVRRNIMDGPTNGIEDEDRGPAVVVDRFFLISRQDNFKHPQILVLEKHFVIGRSGRNRIERWVPLGRVCLVSHRFPPLAIGGRMVAMQQRYSRKALLAMLFGYVGLRFARHLHEA